MQDEPQHAPVPMPCAASAPAYRLFHPDSEPNGQWEWLAGVLAQGAVRHMLGPLRAILKLARENSCASVVVEERYIDPDYRSEYSLFWSRRFEDRPAVAKRVHFFGRQLQAAQLHALPEDADYLGYMVLRPTALGPVGRTVIKPPHTIGPRAVLCTVVDRPSLFGCVLRVEGVPFCQQDGELLRCAHAAAWICHYVAQYRGLIGRRTTAAIAQMPSTEFSRHRPLPSNGLTGEQLQSIFSAIGLPAFFYDAQDPPDPPAPLPKASNGRRATKQQDLEWENAMRRERLLRVACKYINSGFPVVVLTEGEENHAFTLVGWEKTEDGVRLYASDDIDSPYEKIDDVLVDQDKYGKWVGIMLPLPEKVFLTGEAAEQAAWNIAEGGSKLERPNNPQEEDFVALAGRFEHLKAGISVRTMLIEGRELKARLTEKDRGDELLTLYRLSHLPHWVWLVEFHDPEARDRGEPCVVAEILFDSTSHDDKPQTVLSTTLSLGRDHGAMRHGDDQVTQAPGPGAPWSSIILRPPREANAGAATAVA